jgi:predicted RNA-binding protein YlxR (DUF448 family)
VACGRIAPRSSLERYVVRDGALVPDPASRLPGRGAYTCRTADCFEQARARGGFNRAFRQAVRIAPETVPPPFGAPATDLPAEPTRLDSSENVHLDTA